MKTMKPKKNKLIASVGKTLFFTGNRIITILVVLVVLGIFTYTIKTAPTCTEAFCILGKVFYYLIGVFFLGYAFAAIKYIR